MRPKQVKNFFLWAMYTRIPRKHKQAFLYFVNCLLKNDFE